MAIGTVDTGILISGWIGSVSSSIVLNLSLPRRGVSMDEELYCLNLDDYSAASFTSFGKAYYGTMPQISAFIKALAEDERSRKNHEELPSML